MKTGESVASEVLLDLYGLPRDASFSHADFMAVVHPDDRHLVEENARAAMNGKDVAIADQYRIVRANDGAIRWMTASGGFQFDKDGRPIFAMGVVYDITERKQVEIALRETSERLRLAQSAAHIGTWNWDVQADIAWFDDVGMEYLGLPQGVPIHYSDYVGRVPEEERDIVNSAVQAAFAGDGRVLLEHRLVNAQTGVACWVSCRGVFTFDDEGRPVHGAGAVYDITERKLAEEALRESEAEARRQHDELNWIYQNAPIGMCLLDRNLHYRRVNRWLAELNGAPMEAHIGRSVSEMAPDASDQIAQLVRQVVATGQPLKNYLIVRKNSPNSDAVRFLDASYFPLIDEHGEVSGFSVLLEEITDRKLAEEALRHSESEARKQRDELDWIYRNAPIGLAYLDLDLRYRRINDWLANLSQRPVEEHIGLSVFDVVPQFARGAKMIKEWILATGEPVRNLEFSGEMPPNSGVVRHINSSWYPAFSEEGALAGFSVVVEEITERKRAEEALRRSEAKARKQRDELKWIYENTPVGLASLDKDLRFHSINRRLAEMNGLPIEAHIGRTVHEVVPDLSSKVEQLAHKIIATGEPVRNIELEGETAANPGVARYWDESWYPTFDSNGEIAGFSVVVEEVTESKHLQALREADRRKDEFLATLAHELRNPLAPIKNAIHLLQMLNHDDPTAEQKRRLALSRAERQVTHLVRLVDDLLEVTRINHGKIELRKEPVELAAILSQAIDLSHSQIEAGPHQLIVELRSHSLPVEADPVRLAQVFANLLNNAAKFTEAGGRIDVIADREEGEAIVRVRDNGVGIPPEMASSIFDMFTQIKTGVRSGRGGIGIGLALARGIVQLHGGRIEARSAGLGHGSEFIVRLPLVVRQ
ncbi:PAS domain-containing protein [Methylocystis sp. ATCC 49242]|uniref:sensor histidine kinase n=1 Tax=Methylocystis sp. ATCC 49242 TaxID=622637 RepID=UPI001FCB3CC0|nr:PAS domain-containing protein [Methylocystis sp. ATCC 49242]